MEPPLLPMGFEAFRTASTTTVARRGLASMVKAFREVRAWVVVRVYPPCSRAGTRIPGHRGKHVATSPHSDVPC